MTTGGAVAIGSAVAGLAVLGRRIRRRLHFTCHFCGRCAVGLIPAPLATGASFYCPFDDCGQYNGFRPDGSYDRDLKELSDPAYNRQSSCARRPMPASAPALCSQCSCQQALLVQSISELSDPSQLDAVRRRFPICAMCSHRVAHRLKQIDDRRRPAAPIDVSLTLDGTSTPSRVALLSLLLDVCSLVLSIIPYYPIFVSSAVDVALLLTRIVLSVCLARGPDLVQILAFVLNLALTLVRHGVVTGHDLVPHAGHWANVVRVLQVLSNFPLQRTSRRMARRTDPDDISPFSPARHPTLTIRESRRRTPSPKSAPIVSPSRLHLPRSRILDDFSAAEGSQNCFVEDLIASMALTPEPNAPDVRSGRPSGRAPLLNARTPAFLVALTLALFVVSSLVDHWIARAAYAASLVVASIGYPAIIPIAALLLGRLYGPAAIGAVLGAVLASYGVEIVALSALSAVLLFDWSSRLPSSSALPES
ncbi:unnamed protein product (mitochondrion) [Plasmodiophora brassicae]|uniref:Uncharacterized protein n=1 Tax=Plasmodiophora brassicae TaxID=37360 RepID=A0A0G4IIJ3_PLABS|nr:hypothetical protein PBRA_003841 [Plasmodiophora brassicae]SPQ94356.1 unnamed protein product [Plasmodiophora brassicae]